MHKKLRIEHSGDNNNNNNRSDGKMEIDFPAAKRREDNLDKVVYHAFSPSMRMAKLLHMPRITRFVVVSGPTALGNQNGYNALLQNSHTPVSDWSGAEGYSQYFALYRKYRVVKVAAKHEYLPTPNEFKINSVHTMTAGTTSSSVLKAESAYLESPEFAFWADNTGNSTTYGNSDGDWQNIMNRDNIGWHKGYSNYFEWFPRPETTAYESSVSVGEITTRDNPWINVTETAIKYVGANIYINNKGSNVPSNISGTNWQQLITTAIIWVEFKDPNT